jgi:hypothetical protein
MLFRAATVLKPLCGSPARTVSGCARSPRDRSLQIKPGMQFSFRMGRERTRTSGSGVLAGIDPADLRSEPGQL